MNMVKNMGGFDRMIRILIALIVAYLYYINYISGTAAIVLLILAAIFALTSVINFCPLYNFFGINTYNKIDKK